MPYRGGVNMLDILIGFLALLAVLGGFRAGLLARVAAWAGIALGIALSFRTVPFAVELAGELDPPMRLAIGIGAFALTLGVTSAVAGLLGSTIRRTIAVTPLGGLDRLLGAAASAAVVLGMVWLLAPAAADVPGTVAQQVRTSQVVAAIDSYAPEPPDAVRALRRMMASTRFPEVFAELAPSPVMGDPPADVEIDDTVIDAALAATAHVRADGCGKRFDGSSFVVADDLLATNAHVVAGADTVRVRFEDGTAHNATVVYFAPDQDLALLEVANLDRAPLPLARGDIGEPAAALGYPGGQLVVRVAPARLEGRQDAIGRDIYGQQRTTRQVLFLAAELRQGDSGSALINNVGAAVGVVFAISPDNPRTAYALDISELERALASPREPGETGRCM